MRITHGSRDTFPCPANRRFWLSTYVLHASTTLSLSLPPPVHRVNATSPCFRKRRRTKSFARPVQIVSFFLFSRSLLLPSHPISILDPRNHAFPPLVSSSVLLSSSFESRKFLSSTFSSSRFIAHHPGGYYIVLSRLITSGS